MNSSLITSFRYPSYRCFGAAAVMFMLGLAPKVHAEGTALLLDLDGAIGVATTEYVVGGIEDAEDRNAKLVIIRMDTPGGLVNSMRDIVQAILGSNVPVATYVSPNGARADSAGTYILLASHIAAMSPTTHIGACTPVALGGEDSPGPFSPPDRDKGDESDKDEGATEEDEEESEAPDSSTAM